MKKLELVARAADRDAVLGALRRFGAVHLEPAFSGAADGGAAEELARKLKRAERALALIDSLPPQESTAAAEAPAGEDAAAVLNENAELCLRLENEITTYEKELGGVLPWGRWAAAELASIEAAGLKVRFLLVRDSRLEEFASFVFACGGKIRGRRCVVLFSRGQTGELPADAEEVPLPARGALELEEMISLARARLAEARGKIARFARSRAAVEEQRVGIAAALEFERARLGVLDGGEVFGLTGWLPVPAAEAFEKFVRGPGPAVAARLLEPAPGEEPPTHIREPRWAKPIRSIFALLGTVPGYREFDIGAPFLLFLGLFSAMLIGDAGYGLLISGAALAFRRPITRLSPQAVPMALIVGGGALVFGGLSGIFFGLAAPHPVLALDDRTLMRICFILGTAQMVFARLWKAVRLFPSPQFLAQVGWALTLLGLMFVVFVLVVGDEKTPAAAPYLIGAGLVLALFFTTPSFNPLEPLKNLINIVLGALGCFSDIISYVRLMAVGMAGLVLAQSFNTLAGQLGSVWIAVPVLVVGHLVNIGLSGIALFAHGVRLNMLEFCNHLGMEWTGRPYRPFREPGVAPENAD